MDVKYTPSAIVEINNKLTTSLKFSIHQHQGVNIEDYHIYIIAGNPDITEDYFEYDYNVCITKDDYLIGQEKKVAIENQKESDRVLDDDYEFFPYADICYQMTPKRGSIDLLLKRIEKEIQKLTQWRRGSNDLGKKGYVKLLDLPHTEYDTSIILFDEDGNRIKY